jgi:hypothetical protein
MTKFDDIAWKTIHSRSVPKPEFANYKGLEISGRPKNYAELEIAVKESDMQLALSDFLHEFFLFRTPDFFEIEPSDYFSTRDRAWLAGVAEYLCHRFGLAVPEWVEKPEYFLAEPWCKSHDDTGEPEFGRRNVLYSPRHLIRL